MDVESYNFVLEFDFFWLYSTAASQYILIMYSIVLADDLSNFCHSYSVDIKLRYCWDIDSWSKVFSSTLVVNALEDALP